MTYTILNLTDSSRNDNPTNGDYLQYTYADGSVTKQHFYTPVDPTQDEVEDGARQWRDAELAMSDWIVPLTDHPQRNAYMTYRTNLRNWPSTDDFPDTKPTL